MVTLPRQTCSDLYIIGPESSSFFDSRQLRQNPLGPQGNLQSGTYIKALR